MIVLIFIITIALLLLIVAIVASSSSKTEGTKRKAKSASPREFAAESKVCPYCKIDLSKRNVPTRRSSFKCPGCSKKVYADPKQPIYPYPFLSETEKTYADYLRQLDIWIFARGSNADYAVMKDNLTRKFGHSPKPGDVIWGLMNLSMQTCGSDFRGDVRDLMKKFREFEKSLKPKPPKKAKPRTKTPKKNDPPPPQPTGPGDGHGGGPVSGVVLSC